MLQDRPNDGTRSLASSPTSPFYLLVIYEDCHICVFTMDHDGERVLPVFSNEVQALSFLRAALPGGPEDELWQVRSYGNGEIVSLLFGPCQKVSRVALDPASGFDALETVGPTLVSRRCFLDELIGRGRAWFYSKAWQGQ